MVVRYEDLVSDPRTTVARVLQFARLEGIGREDLAHISPGMVRLGEHHTVAGNPMRFQIGTIELRLDEDWRRRMPARERRLVSLLTAPLRLLYRYLR